MLSTILEMELIIFITLLNIFFSALLPSTCSSSQIQLQPSLHHQGSVNVHAHDQLPLPTLPRKLRFAEKVDESGGEAKDLASHKEKDSLPTGKKYDRKQNMVLGNKESRQEWIEGEDDTSKYFTMDYHGVRRRRPIHNKHLPVTP
ncbi:uncharacterized protein LOC130739701 [Lotus japonicus]|uniref:uncharacterized protein LOC130739701 n=1 Tax=Lotus japonicus TaxID=34305 RepID=UPI002587752B|nr:uncharacterized protein LOC130739701 [Lotus japonicus]